MAFLEIKDVEIKAIATAVPKQVKVAKEQPFFTDIEAENFTKVTGVISSHVAPADMTLSDLCQAAAEKLFEASGWERESIDLIITDQPLPKTLEDYAARQQIQLRYTLE